MDQSYSRVHETTFEASELDHARPDSRPIVPVSTAVRKVPAVAADRSHSPNCLGCNVTVTVVAAILLLFSDIVAGAFAKCAAS